MSWLDRLLSRKSSQDDVYARWLELLGQQRQSKAGPEITRETAVRVSAAFACMAVISKGVARMPFKLFRETQLNGRRNIQRATDLDLYDVVTAKPNAWQSSFDFMEQLTLHLSLGNAYVFKNLYRGQVAEMFLLLPGSVKATQKADWSTEYVVTGKDGQQLKVPPENIWHVRGTSWDGFLGLDTLNLARDVLGLSLALDDSISSLHRNGIRPSGMYSVDTTLDAKQHSQLVEWLKKNAAQDAVGSPLVLDRGAKWISTSLTSVDAQLREIRQDIIPDVCRFFGVLPIMIGYTGDKASTYASAEAMFKAHDVHTIDPVASRIARSADVNLLSDKDRKSGLYFKFVTHALLNASAKDQAEFLARALGSGGGPAWMTQDEARELLELNPMGGAASELPPLAAAKAPPPPAP